MTLRSWSIGLTLRTDTAKMLLEKIASSDRDSHPPIRYLMDARSLLDRLLESSQRASQTGIRMARERTVVPTGGDEHTAMLKGAGAGALGAGAVALLFGSKGTRKFAKKAAKLGGTAALGAIAHKAFSEWQARQGTGSSSTLKPDFDKFAATGTPIDALADADATLRSESIVRAMISAARADGHVDERELELISEQIESLGLERDVTRFLLAELGRPVDVQRIAALADTPETAAELYLASALVVDLESAEERVYLERLAAAMNLESAVVERLEAPLQEG